MISMISIKKIIEKIPKIGEIITPRRVGVTVIFVVVLLYHFGIVTKVKEESDVASTDGAEQQTERVADLDATIRSKIFYNILTASPGGYYRVMIEAEASEDGAAHVFARSLSGAKRDIGTIDLVAGEKKFAEYVFQADDFYDAVVIEMAEERDDMSWDGVKVYISDVRASALNVRNAFEARMLAPTQTRLRKSDRFYVSATKEGEKTDELSIPKSIIGNYFEADADAVSAVWIRPSVIGSGGDGQYEIELRAYENKQGGESAKVIMSSGFFVGRSLENHREKNGWYRFALPSPLERGKVYYVGISNKGVAVDAHNFLRLHRLEADEKIADSFLALDVARDVGDNAHAVLSGATVEDVGDRYVYRYAFAPEPEAVLDVYNTQGRIKYKEKLKAIVMNAQQGASYVYKFDFPHPLRAAQITARQLGDYKDEIALEYSFDGTVWKKIDYVQRSGGSQLFDGRITADVAGASERLLLLRVRYVGETRKLKEFGLESLEFVAELAK